MSWTMAKAVSFLKNQVDEADLTHFTENEIGGYIADAYEYLVTQLCREVPSYYIKVGSSVPVLSGNRYVDLPTDAIGCVHSVEIYIVNEWYPLAAGKRRRPTFYGSVSGTPIQFSLFGHDKIVLYPLPDKAEQVRFTYPYVPTVPTPDSEGAYDQAFVFTFPRGYERLIPERAIVDCGFKEKSEIQHAETFARRHERLKAQMMAYVAPSQTWEGNRISRLRG